MKFLLFSIFTLIGFLSSLPKAIGQDLALFEWETSPRAAYYLLKVETESKKFYVRANQGKITLRASAQIQVLAFNFQGHIIGTPLAAKKLISLPGTALADLDQVNLSEHKTLKARPKPSRQALILKAQEQAEIKRLKQLEREEKTAFAHAPYRHFISTVGMGVETIQAAGGASTFKGQSTSGNSTFYLRFKLGSQPASNFAKFNLQARLNLHNFVTSQLVQVDNSVDNFKQKLELSRASAGLAVHQQLWAHKAIKLLAGYGLGFFQLPMMKIKNADNGASEIDEQNIISPLLSTSLIAASSQVHQISVDLQLLPWPVNIGKGYQSLLELKDFYYFSPFLYSSLILSHGRERLNHQLVCPRDASACQTRGSSVSSTTSLNLGLGLFF